MFEFQLKGRRRKIFVEKEIMIAKNNFQFVKEVEQVTQARLKHVKGAARNTVERQ